MIRILFASLATSWFILAAGCGARCVKWDEASKRIEQAGADERSAIDAELSRRGLTRVEPQMMREVNDGTGPSPWSAIMTPPREGIDVDLPTLVSVGDPRPVVKDAQGRFYTLVVAGNPASEEVVLCGCDPGHGTEMRPSFPYWQVQLPSLDAYQGDVTITVKRRSVTTRYERDTGAPGECHSAP